MLPVRARLATARARLVFSDFLILRFSYFLSSNFQFSEWLMVSSPKIPPSAHNYRVYGTNECNFHTFSIDSMMVMKEILDLETRVRVYPLFLSRRPGCTCRISVHYKGYPFKFYKGNPFNFFIGNSL